MSNVDVGVRQLQVAVVALESQLQRLERNCERIEEYHENLVKICNVWKGWIRNGKEMDTENAKADE